MGKKRRLKSAKAKFAAKHSHHPRMALLNGYNIPTEAEETISKIEVVAEEKAVAETVEEVAPNVVEKKVKAAPKSPAKKKKAKKTRTIATRRTKKKADQDATA